MDIDFVEASKRRRWDVTIFRNQVVDGALVNVIVKEYRNVRSKWAVPSGLLDYHGVLQFVDEDGKQFAAASIPFIATEGAPAP